MSLLITRGMGTKNTLVIRGMGGFQAVFREYIRLKSFIAKVLHIHSPIR